MNSSISDTIPLYLADKLSLDDAIQLVTTTPPSKRDLLISIFSEAKSLPREIDTHPTSPTPDRPSPAQERLLGFLRAVQSVGFVGGRGGGPSGTEGGAGGGTGYGIELDAGEGSFGANNRQTGEGEWYGEEGRDEEYELVKDIIRASFPSFPSTSPTSSTTATATGARTGGRARAQSSTNTYPEQRIPNAEPTSPFEASDPSTSTAASTSTTTSKPGLSISISTTHHRRSSSTSGPTKQFNNLISFLAFMTKENLLLSPGVGERIAIEMVRDTLSHHGSSIHSHTDPSHGSGYGYGKGESTPWFGDAGPESISAAALWMIIMGEELFARVQDQEKGKGKEVQRSRPGAGTGTTRTPKKGRGGIVDEWETWMARLQYLSLREDLNVEAREAAAEGAAVMRRV